jgi:hypothetical protein
MRYCLISAGFLRKNHPETQNFTENFSVEPVRQALKKRKIISTYDPGKKISSNGTKQLFSKKYSIILSENGKPLFFS